MSFDKARELLREVIMNILSEDINVDDVKIKDIKKLTEFKVPAFIEGCHDSYWVIMVDAEVRDASGEWFRNPVIFVIGVHVESDDGVNCIAFPHYSIDVLHHGPLHVGVDEGDVIAEYLLREADAISGNDS